MVAVAVIMIPSGGDDGSGDGHGWWWNNIVATVVISGGGRWWWCDTDHVVSDEALCGNQDPATHAICTTLVRLSEGAGVG